MLLSFFIMYMYFSSYISFSRYANKKIYETFEQLNEIVQLFVTVQFPLKVTFAQLGIHFHWLILIASRVKSARKTRMASARCTRETFCRTFFAARRNSAERRHRRELLKRGSPALHASRTSAEAAKYARSRQIEFANFQFRARRDTTHR